MGTGDGENRAVEAAKKAISSRLLEESSIQGARGVLINITGGHDLLLHEVSEASNIIHDAAAQEVLRFKRWLLGGDKPQHHVFAAQARQREIVGERRYRRQYTCDS